MPSPTVKAGWTHLDRRGKLLTSLDWSRESDISSGKGFPFMIQLGKAQVTGFDPARDVRIIHEPSVYLVGRQTVDATVVDRFLADHGVSWKTDTEVAGEHLAEVAGRLCYMSFAKPRPGGNKAYLDHILEVGHGSVLEHAVWNFVFAGISRSCTHELVRHRHMGY